MGGMASAGTFSPLNDRRQRIAVQQRVEERGDIPLGIADNYVVDAEPAAQVIVAVKLPGAGTAEHHFRRRGDRGDLPVDGLQQRVAHRLRIDHAAVDGGHRRAVHAAPARLTRGNGHHARIPPDRLPDGLGSDDGHLLRRKSPLQQGGLDATQPQRRHPRPPIHHPRARHQQRPHEESRRHGRLARHQHAVEERVIIGNQGTIGGKHDRESVRSGHILCLYFLQVDFSISVTVWKGARARPAVVSDPLLFQIAKQVRCCHAREVC